MTNATQTTNPVKTKPRRWFRFRLRTLLVMVSLVSVPLGWFGWEIDQRRREKLVIAWVEEMGGYVQIHAGPYVKQSWWEETKDSWWKQTKDIWFAGRVCRVFLEEAQVSDLTPLAELKNLEVLDLRNTQLSDLSPLTKLKNLKWLRLEGTPVSDEQVEQLRLALPNCDIIN